MEDKESVWTRAYFRQPYQKPFLFYVLFDADTTNLSVSKSEHNIDGMPQELEIVNYSRADEQQKTTLKAFMPII